MGVREIDFEEKHRYGNSYVRSKEAEGRQWTAEGAEHTAYSGKIARREQHIQGRR
jgi:hypothetical protein